MSGFSGLEGGKGLGALRRWVPQALLSVFIVVLVVKSLDILGVQFDDTIARTTTLVTFNATVTGSHAADTALLGITGVALGAVAARRLPKGGVSALFNWDSLLALTAAATVLGTLALAGWFIHPLVPSPVYQGGFWTAAALEDQIFQTFGLLSPLLLVLTLLPLLVKLGVSSGSALLGKDTSAQTQGEDKPVCEGGGARFGFAELLVVVATAFLIAVGSVYPYLTGVNPAHAVVSVDTPRYLLWIQPALGANTPALWVSAIFSPAGSYPGAYAGDLPLFLAFLQSVSAVVGGVSTALYAMPLILGSLLALSSFFVMQVWRGDVRLSALCALLSISSFQSIAGIYAGFFADWFAVVLLNVMFGLLILNWRRPAVTTVAAASALSVGTVLAHPYTWLVAAATLSALVVAGIGGSLRRGEHLLNRRTVSSLAVLGAGAGASLVQARLLSFNAFGWGAAQLSGPAMSLSAFLARSFNLGVSLNFLYGGFLNNPVLLVLVVYWVAFSRKNGMGDRFVLAWLSLSAVPVLFGNPTIQSRTLYDLPLQFPAAIGLVAVADRLEKKRKWLGSCLVALVLVLEADFFLRSVANLVPLGGVS